jgi:DNA anti-recombination protein RmuC
MSRATIPSRSEILTALAELRADSADTGRQPTVLSLAPQLGLANTTFRRKFPDIAADLAHQAAERRQAPPEPGRREQLEEASARLRQENRQLREQIEAATAVIQRITLENHQLRQEVEAPAKVTRLGGQLPPRPRQPVTDPDCGR